jgi:tetratricopeptide (TPR) repeat protein
MKASRHVLAALVLLTLFAAAGCSFVSDWSTCDKPAADPAAAVAACTRLIESGRLNGASLAAILTDRAAAHFNLRQLDRSLADLDQAIRTQPDFTIALVRRAGLHAFRGELDQALADANRAVALNPKDVGPRLERAQILGMKHDFAGQIGELDAVLAAAPDNPDVMNSRCWARATHGTDLDLALADCNASLRLRPNDAHTLDSRGFVYLRMRRYTEAIRDYDAAISREPGLAPSFYGRGLAKRAIGDAAGSVSDISSAKALGPNVVREFQGYGIAMP